MNGILVADEEGMNHLGETDCLSFSSKDIIPPAYENLVANDKKEAEVEKKSKDVLQSELKLTNVIEGEYITINTREGNVKTSSSSLGKYVKNAKNKWLDFRTAEVNDFLDVLGGRKQHLRHSEHVIEIGKIFDADMKALDTDMDIKFNKIANQIKEQILLDVYKIFPGGIITRYNAKLIISPRTPPRPGFCLKHNSPISNPHAIWKKINGMNIDLRLSDKRQVTVKIAISTHLNEYWIMR